MEKKAAEGGEGGEEGGGGESKRGPKPIISKWSTLKVGYEHRTELKRKVLRMFGEGSVKVQ
jgi:hypothetical protein